MSATLIPGTRVQSVPVPESIGSVLPRAEWPVGIPEQWTEENTVIVRWDRQDGASYSVFAGGIAGHVLRVLAGDDDLDAPVPYVPVDSPPRTASSQAGLQSYRDARLAVPALVQLDRQQAWDAIAKAAIRWCDTDPDNEANLGIDTEKDLCDAVAGYKRAMAR